MIQVTERSIILISCDWKSVSVTLYWDQPCDVLTLEWVGESIKGTKCQRSDTKPTCPFSFWVEFCHLLCCCFMSSLILYWSSDHFCPASVLLHLVGALLLCLNLKAKKNCNLTAVKLILNEISFLWNTTWKFNLVLHSDCLCTLSTQWEKKG